MKPTPEVIPAKPSTFSIKVPSNLGKACSSENGRFVMTSAAVIPHRRDPSRHFLAATDGRMLAVVPTEVEVEGDAAEAGLTPHWIPQGLAKPSSKDSRTLRLVKGEKQGLFGAGLKWVDDENLCFDEHPDGGAFPPVASVFPEMEPGAMIVGLSVDLLARLMQALNGPGSDNPGGLRLVFMRPRAGEYSGPIAVVGGSGIGLVMPSVAAVEPTKALYSKVREEFIEASSVAVQVANDAKPIVNIGDTIDAGTGEVLTAPVGEPDADAANRTERTDSAPGDHGNNGEKPKRGRPRKAAAAA